MKDFQLTKTGDLMFCESKLADNSLCISFLVSSLPSLEVSFYVAKSDAVVAESDRTLSVSFDVIAKRRSQEAMLLDGAGSLKQAIKIRLSAELGELSIRKTVGSRLSSVKHGRLFDDKNIQLTRQYAKSAISDILPNAVVEVTPSALSMSYIIKITAGDETYSYEL
jgi:hypothetical protein